MTKISFLIHNYTSSVCLSLHTQTRTLWSNNDGNLKGSLKSMSFRVTTSQNVCSF